MFNAMSRSSDHATYDSDDMIRHVFAGTEKQRRPLSPVERQNYDFTSDIQDIFSKEIASLPEE